jgi:hypothetical protein
MTTTAGNGSVETPLILIAWMPYMEIAGMSLTAWPSFLAAAGPGYT